VRERGARPCGSFDLALRRPYTFTVLAVLMDQLAQSRRDIALDLVALYKALGGGLDVG